jgi:predicted HTH transcriptional regulator
MTLTELKGQIALGEDSRRQFKRDITNADSLAAEMAAFANSDGGAILLGVADDGSLPGLGRADVKRINQLIGNAASQHVRSPLTVQTENVAVAEGRVVIVLTDDRDGLLFTATVHRKERESSEKTSEVADEGSLKSSGEEESSQESSQKSSQKIIELMQNDPTITIADLAKIVGITDRAIKKQIEKLRVLGLIRRIGPDKGGHWEVSE